jgi:predicted transcriptional regulator
MLIELLEQEKLVLNVVQEYLNKNRYLNMNEIIPFIISRFRNASININISGIEDILRSLIKKNLIVEGSKLSINDILRNEKRKNIYHYILQNPGIYFNRIVRELNISNHVVVWHLNILLKFQFIKKAKIENHEIYFESNYDQKDLKLSYFTSKDKGKKMIEYLKEYDYGITKTQLAKELKMHINTITKYLKIFEQIGIVFSKKASKRNLYFLSEDFIEI